MHWGFGALHVCVVWPCMQGRKCVIMVQKCPHWRQNIPKRPYFDQNHIFFCSECVLNDLWWSRLAWGANCEMLIFDFNLNYTCPQCHEAGQTKFSPLMVWLVTRALGWPHLRTRAEFSVFEHLKGKNGRI